MSSRDLIESIWREELSNIAVVPECLQDWFMFYFVPLKRFIESCILDIRRKQAFGFPLQFNVNQWPDPFVIPFKRVFKVVSDFIFYASLELT